MVYHYSMDVSIILINYNTKQLTIDCINSIVEKSSGFDYEILLIDNKSADDSLEAFSRLNYPCLKVIENDDNEGTSRAFNKCAKVAKGKYVFWLNTDTILVNNAIYELFNYMEHNSKCGIAGGNLFNKENKPAFSFRKRILDLKEERRDKSLCHQLRMTIIKKMPKYMHNYSSSPKRVSHVSGADMMIRTSLFNTIGYFNENIFMYAEETDFEYRMLKNTDNSSYSVPSAKIIHLEGQSFEKNKSLNEFKFFHMVLGETKYIYYNFGEKYAIRFLKIYRRLIRKILLMAYLCHNKKTIEKNKNKLSLFNNYINNFDTFINSFKDYGD